MTKVYVLIREEARVALMLPTAVGAFDAPAGAPESAQPALTLKLDVRRDGDTVIADLGETSPGGCAAARRKMPDGRGTSIGLVP